MSATDLRDAFNAVVSPAFRCSKAFQSYEMFQDIQWERLRFVGNSAAGVPFDVQSNRLRAGYDLQQAARETAQNLLNNPPVGSSPV